MLQGQASNLESLFARTSSFSNALADNSQTVQQLIDNLNSVLATISKDGEKFSGTVDRLEKLVTGLAQDRNPIGEAITALDAGTASLTDLLNEARAPLAGTVDEQRFVQSYTEMFGGPPWEPSPIEKIMGKWRRWRSKPDE